MGIFVDHYRLSRKMNDWRYECARDIERLGDDDFFGNARACIALEAPSITFSAALGKRCGAVVSYYTNFVPFKSSIEYVNREIGERVEFLTS